jgi:hypothetical protein
MQERCYNAELFCGKMEENDIHPLTYATLYSSLIKTKLIPFIIIKIVLDTAF